MSRRSPDQLSHKPNSAFATTTTDGQHSHTFRAKLSLSGQTHWFQQQLETQRSHVSFNGGGWVPTATARVLVPSGEDASEGVERQRERFGHVAAQARVSLLALAVSGPDGLLDAVGGVQARRHLDAAESHMVTGSRLSGSTFTHKCFCTRSRWFITH